jgi:proline dehydrogenase
MWDAMLEICDATMKQKSRLWIDAEQQDLQGTIDQWTVELMRKYNRGGRVMIYTTMQAYLKNTGENILNHLKLAQAEGWHLGIKLVRGAYIATERRDLIHNTIDDTHNAYNTIVERILRQQYPGITPDMEYPKVALFLATHNDDSIKKCYAIQESLITAGKPTIELGYGQLQGMADEVSCGLLQLCQTENSEKNLNLALAPHAFKCLAYGSTQECLQFLLRRVKENSDALGRTKYWVAGFREELWRRLKAGSTW